MRTQTPNGIAYKFLLEKPGADTAVLDFLRAAGCIVKKQPKIIQQDFYLDTYDWRLFRDGLALRLRHTKGKYVCTLENCAKSEGGKNDRQETGITAKQNFRDRCDDVPQEIMQKIKDIIYPRRLITQLTVRTEREPFVAITGDETEILVGFDSTAFQATGLNKPHRAERFFEMQMELQKGALERIDSVVKNITRTFSFRPSLKPTLKTAIERLDIKFPAKNPPDVLTVKGDDRLDVAIQKILAFQLSRLQENIPGVKADIDTEFVHQGRVATRRMRSIIKLFKGAIPQRSAVYFAGELSWLASLFGAVRDLDVFLLNLPGFLAEIDLAPQKTKDVLLKQIREERLSRLADLNAGLSSSRWRIFFLRLSSFSRRKPASKPLASLALNTVCTTAPLILSELFERVIKRGNILLGKPKLKNYHRLRIEFKKLRYASEFFNSAAADRLTPFIAGVIEIQDCLGKLQDTVFTKALIKSFIKKWKGGIVDPMLVFTLGEIYQLQQKISEARQAEFREIWARFDTEGTRERLQTALDTMQKRAG